ncbi:50S ribosomal protein L10 [Candidatus Micrarchaeota archaeon]|nr:50S ribosomal protein L10 [Candidatus Micrarchaeota archaeon]MBU1930033.1 50S ribosomal protein L10 [Candidatus Micrarchaeota archaeon]
MKRHTSTWKKQSLSELQELAKQYPIVAIADIEGFPADLFQKIRKKLKGKAEIRVSKTRLIKRMLEEHYSKEKEFHTHAQKMCAILFTKLNPFELFAIVKKNKGKTSAKPGQLAPEDILIPAGDTGLPPGPALSDLKNAGLKVKMQGPTIHIAADKIVTKKGEAISAPVAAVLSKLNIKPIKVGLNITAILENKTVYLSTVLDIDEEKVLANFKKAYLDALSLALEIGYSTPETIKILVQKAFGQAKIIALKAKIVTPYTVQELLRQADAVAADLKSKLKETAIEKPIEEKKEEKKEEKSVKKDSKETKSKKEEPKEEKKE